MELYIHLPYCQQKCRYCDFASYPGQEATMERYVNAILAEADTYNHTADVISTVFIGGGTPSIFPAKLFCKLLIGLHRRFHIRPGAEITAEANPGTITDEWLEAAVSNGVNRISMGMQAAQNDLLKRLGRIHTMEEVTSSVQRIRLHGIRNLNLDLMFGLPGQTRPLWKDSLEEALALAPEHISCYGLIPEDGTPLKADLDVGRLTLPSEEAERQMYDDALDTLSGHGYQQYEISNFALPGYECQHNIGYWKQIPYIGLGAAAASMLPADANSEIRTTNPAGIQPYISMVYEQNWSLRTKEIVSSEDARFETLMLGLRMNDGISESDFLCRHGISLDAYRGTTLNRLAAVGLLKHVDGYWRLTRKGMDVQNAILVELMDD